MRPWRKTLATAATAVLLTGTAVVAGAAAPAGAQPNMGVIGRRQYFAGLVNGNMGQSVLSVLGCPQTTPAASPDKLVAGPGSAGSAGNAQGHPMRGQTISVRQFLVPPPTAVGSTLVGYTGAGRKISADLVVNMTEPPLAYLVHLATFTTYNTNAWISPFLNLPCNATFQVVFRPLNGGTKSRPSIVTLAVGVPRILAGSPVTSPRSYSLTGSGFVPSTTYTIAECSQTGWVVTQDPCVDKNSIKVTTDAGGGFSHAFQALPCSAAVPSTCYLGAPVPMGIDTIELVGAVQITVS